MRRFVSIALFMMIAGNANAENYSLKVSQVKPLQFKSAATGVVVGNAGIADVIVHDANTIVLMGKSVGSTSVLILGEKGKVIFSGDVTVNAPEDENVLTIQKGTKIQTANCNDRCVEIVSLESDAESIATASNGIRAYSTFANGSGSGSVSLNSGDAAQAAPNSILPMPQIPGLSKQ